jgi:hypothetical protein
MVSELWNPIQEYIDTLNNKGSMPAVHHYTTIRGALGILESGRMWLTERTHLNDPSELSLGIAIAEATLSQLGRKQDATRLDEVVRKVFHDFRFFSGSFSFEYDDLSQWRNYADDGTGVILSFKASAFNNPKHYIDQLIIDNPTAIACPMSYCQTCLKNVIGHLIRRWDGQIITELFDHLLMISSMFKNNCWASENEYRFFVHHQREKILKSPYYKIRERNNQLISYLDLPVQNWNSTGDFPIYRVSLGPATADGVAVQFEDFLVSRGIPISRSNIVRSKLPYRSIRQI